MARSVVEQTFREAEEKVVTSSSSDSNFSLQVLSLQSAVIILFLNGVAQRDTFSILFG